MSGSTSLGAIEVGSATDISEEVVAGRVVVHNAAKDDEILMIMAYGPVKPGFMIETIYGDVMATAVGGDLDIFVKVAVDTPEYMVVGRILPEDSTGRIVGPIKSYGPVKPGTKITTPYGVVTVSDAGGDISILVNVSGPKKTRTVATKPSRTGHGSDKNQPMVDLSRAPHDKNDHVLPETGESEKVAPILLGTTLLISLLLLARKRRENESK
jgi:LPXTG-motif cell wall-anchored protein